MEVPKMPNALNIGFSALISGKKELDVFSSLVDVTSPDILKGTFVSVPPTIKKESWIIKQEKLERKKRKRQKENLLFAKKKAKLKAIAKEERKKAKRAAANMWSGRCSKCQKNGKGANYCRNIVCHRGPDWRVERDRILMLSNGGILPPKSSAKKRKLAAAKKLHQQQQQKLKGSTQSALGKRPKPPTALNRNPNIVRLEKKRALRGRRAFPKIPGTPDFVCYLSPTASSDDDENNDDWTY
jgi:hypothetical protein